MIKYLLIIPAFVIAAASPEVVQARTEHIWVDYSNSPKAVTDPAFMRVIARRLAGEIQAQPNGTTVSLRSFGNINANNLLRYDVRITKRSNPKRKVATQVARLLMGLATSKRPRQNRTEIVAAFKYNEYDCRAGDRITIITDGLESGVASERAMLDGTAKLPKLASTKLKGCSVRFWSMGQLKQGNVSSAQIANLDRLWRGFVTPAGGRYSMLVSP